MANVVRWGLGFVLGLGAVAMALPGCGSTDDGPKEPACDADQKRCNGICVSIRDWRYGCGAETCDRCEVANAKVTCGAQGECAVEYCASAYDCDGDPQNGCEALISVQHCGGCGIACPTNAPHATDAYCFQELASEPHACGLRCEPGYKDADGDVYNGCENPVLFSLEWGCPLDLPGAGTECEYGGTCTYAHPEIACTQTMVCAPSETQTLQWKDGRPCS